MSLFPPPRSQREYISRQILGVLGGATGAILALVAGPLYSVDRHFTCQAMPLGNRQLVRSIEVICTTGGFLTMTAIARMEGNKLT